MRNCILSCAPFISAIFFPWMFTAGLALLAVFFEPLVPLAVGLFADTLYFEPSSGMPVFTLAGAVVTTIAFFVRSRLRTSTIG